MKFNYIKVFAVVILLLVFCNFSLQAQQNSSTKEISEPPSVFLGVGLGINDYGFGGYLEVPLAEKLSLYGNVGLGGWGYKVAQV